MDTIQSEELIQYFTLFGYESYTLRKNIFFPISTEKRDTPILVGKSHELARVYEHLYHPIMFSLDLPITSI
jgi:hypothetical protein